MRQSHVRWPGCEATMRAGRRFAAGSPPCPEERFPQRFPAGSPPRSGEGLGERSATSSSFRAFALFALSRQKSFALPVGKRPPLTECASRFSFRRRLDIKKGELPPVTLV